MEARRGEAEAPGSQRRLSEGPWLAGGEGVGLGLSNTSLFSGITTRPSYRRTRTLLPSEAEFWPPPSCRQQTAAGETRCGHPAQVAEGTTGTFSLQPCDATSTWSRHVVKKPEGPREAAT